MVFLLQSNDYGYLGYLLMLLPAIVVFLVLLTGFWIIDFIIKKSLKNDFKKQSIVYGVLAGILTVIILFTFYQGTYTETVYVAIPTSFITFFILRKFKSVFNVRFVSDMWLLSITLLLTISIFRAIALF